MCKEARLEATAFLKFDGFDYFLISFAGGRKSDKHTDAHQLVIQYGISTLIAYRARKIDKRLNLFFERCKLRIEIFREIYVSKK